MGNTIRQAPKVQVAVPSRAPGAVEQSAVQGEPGAQPLTDQQVAQRTGLADQGQAVQNFAQSGERQVAPRKLGLLNLLSQANASPGDWGRVPVEARSGQLAQLAQQARAENGAGAELHLERDPELARLAGDMGWKPPFSFEEALFLMQMKYADKKEKELLSMMNQLAQ